MMNRLVFGGLLVLLSACSSTTGSGTEEGTDGGSNGTGTGTGTTSTSAFIGKWMYTAGSGTLNCDGMAQTVAGGGTLTYSNGLTAGTILESGTETSCTTTYTVSGSTATAAAGQVCTLMENGGTETRTLQTGTVTVSADGKTLSTVGSANDVLNNSQTGSSQTCTLSGMLTYTKIGN